ncbi:YjbQ family protein [Candidatus Gottesmanbacteria bacterium]|nr:YjbQ family protein [Candidatus Gottesmanbacteria bacterium]
MIQFYIKTKGDTDIIDITNKVSEIVSQEKVSAGVVNVFVKGSTAVLTTIEADENLYNDLREVLEKIIPVKKDWRHHQTWGDDNGGSHLRAAFFGPSLTVPVTDGKLILGTWQKIVLIDFDTTPRQREITVSCLKG